MGIYIKEIRKPKVCREKPSWNMQDIGCQFCIDGGWGYECLITGRAIDEKGVLDEECPLVEVKVPHGDLIDRDKAIDGAKVDGAWSALAYEPSVIENEVE